jgi:hypothetical protein
MSRPTKDEVGRKNFDRYLFVLESCSQEYDGFFKDVANFGIPTAIYNAGFVVGEENEREKKSV